MKIWRILATVVLVAVMIIGTVLPVYAAISLHEYWNTGGDANSISIYGGEIVAEQFTSEATSHSVASIKVELLKVGIPYSVKVALRTAAAGVPTGGDLTSLTVSGTVLSTSYTIYDFDVPDYSLLPSTQYAVVVSCPSGDNANYVQWHQDSGGGLVSAVGSHSHDSGISWTSDTPADYLFEIWGDTVLQIKSAKVFQNYMTTGDWLITAECLNTYPDYYEATDVTQYFNVQLLNPAGAVVIAATTLKSWGDSPIGIYLSPTSVIPLTYGDAYIVRMIGTFAGAPSVSYTLQTADWRGSDLTNLDKWAVQTADNMNTYSGNTTTHPYSARITGGGKILTAEGGSYFTDGIAGLESVRPDLFQTVISTPKISIRTANNVYDNATTYQVQVGADITADAATFGALFGVTGKTFLAMFFYGILILAMVFVFFNTQGAETPIVLILCIPILFYGTHLRIIPMQVSLVLGAICALLWVRKMWWSAT